MSKKQYEVTLIQLLKQFSNKPIIGIRNIPNIMLGITGFIYMSGYLINANFLRSVGIESCSLLRANYIEAGVVFIFYTSAFIVVPWYSYSLINEIRGKCIRRKKNFGDCLKTLIATVIVWLFSLVFLIILLFTKEDWNNIKIPCWKIVIVMKYAISIYLVLIPIGM